MKKTILLLLTLLPALAYSQLYTDASSQLPNNGAKSASMDVRAADIDKDGDLDIILANEFQANTILINDGNANFSNGTAGKLPQEVHDSEDVAIDDFNKDGFLDLVFCSEDDVVNGGQDVHEYYLGNGSGSFSIAGYQPPDTEANAVIVAEINGDTFPDLLFGNDGITTVLINQGNGEFAPENNRLPQVIRTTQDLAMADVDGDGDMDLFEGNENGNVLFINDGNGFFTDETNQRLPGGLNIETRKVTFGDVDDDGDMDIFLSNVAFIPGKNQQNRLFLNDSTGHFTDVSSTHLPADNDLTIDAIFEDVDLDGDPDLVVCNVFGAPIKLYRNDGSGHFSLATFTVFGQTYIRDALGVIAEDFNGDGLKDLYICDRYQQQTNRKDLLLLRNPVVSTGEVKPQTPFKLYPNPAGSELYIETQEQVQGIAELYDLNGRMISNLSPQPAGKNLWRVKLPPGLSSTRSYVFQWGNNSDQIMIRQD